MKPKPHLAFVHYPQPRKGRAGNDRLAILGNRVLSIFESLRGVVRHRHLVLLSSRCSKQGDRSFYIRARSLNSSSIHCPVSCTTQQQGEKFEQIDKQFEQQQEKFEQLNKQLGTALGFGLVRPQPDPQFRAHSAEI